MQGVLSVTSWAADALGVSDTVGTLEGSKAADILVVQGNPADDINALWNVEDVFLAGRKIESRLRRLHRRSPPAARPNIDKGMLESDTQSA